MIYYEYYIVRVILAGRLGVPAGPRASQAL